MANLHFQGQLEDIYIYIIYKAISFVKGLPRVRLELTAFRL